VAESPMFVFGSGRSGANASNIATAVISVNRGCEARPDGTYAIIFGASAATADDWGQRDLKNTRCMSIAFKDDVGYWLLKSGADSFDGCPVPPVPADFQGDGSGGSLDLDALRADSAGVLRRLGGEDVAAEWPTELAGIWKGKLLAGTGVGGAHAPDVTAYNAVIPGGAVRLESSPPIA
jgi:hypothetical protein